MDLIKPSRREMTLLLFFDTWELEVYDTRCRFEYEMDMGKPAPENKHGSALWTAYIRDIMASSLTRVPFSQHELGMCVRCKKLRGDNIEEFEKFSLDLIRALYPGAKVYLSHKRANTLPTDTAYGWVFVQSSVHTNTAFRVRLLLHPFELVLRLTTMR